MKILLRFRINLAPREMIADMAGGFCVSPDGRSIVVRAREDGNRPTRLRLYHMDRIDGVELAGADFVQAQCFSPDGRVLASANAKGKIQLLRLSEGAVQSLDVPSIDPRGMAWLNDAELVITKEDDIALYLVNVGTGGVERLTTLDLSRGEYTHSQPCAVPDRRAVLFTCLACNEQTERFRRTIEALDLRTGARTVVVENAARPRMVGQGVMLFARGTSIRRVRFDPRSLRTIGESAEVATVATDELACPVARFDASPTGTLVLDPSPRNYENTEVVHQPFGQAPRPVVHTGPYAVNVDVSADERLLAVACGRVNTRINLFNLASGSRNALPAGAGPAVYPLLTPDARHVAYSDNPTTTTARLLIAPSDARSPARVLLDRSDASSLIPGSFSPDGAWLYFTMTIVGGVTDIYRIAIDGGSAPERVLPDEGKAKRLSPAISPDGQVLAFSSPITGGTNLYVTTFPQLSQRTRVSPKLGLRPQWAADSRTLFFCDFQDLFRVTVTREPSLAAGEPELLVPGAAAAHYKVAPAGTGVYMCSPPGGRDMKTTSLEVLTGLTWS